MSLVFSDPTNSNGIVERLRRKVGVASNPTAYPIEEIVSDVNAAKDAFTLLELEASGKWNADDSTQEKLPIILMDLIAGQRDYSYETDESGNVILESYKWMVADQNGFYRVMTPVDPSSESGTEMFDNGQEVQGIPYEYDKTGNTLRLNPIPSYNMRYVEEGKCGLKGYISREGVYFTVDDTDTTTGTPGVLDEYYVLHAAYQYADRNSLSMAGGVLRNGGMTGILREVADFERKITRYFGSRARDERPKLTPRITRFR